MLNKQIFNLKGLFVIITLTIIGCSGGGGGGSDNQGDNNGNRDMEYDIKTMTLQSGQNFDFSSGSVVEENGDLSCNILYCIDSIPATSFHTCGLALEPEFNRSVSFTGDYDIFIQHISDCTNILENTDFVSHRYSLGGYDKEAIKFTPYDPTVLWIITEEHKLAVIYIQSVEYSPTTSTNVTFKWKYPCCDINVWYEDNDNDGYGNPANVRLSSAQPAGYVDNRDDCDDSEATIYPGATEIPDDGIDQDCNGDDLQEVDWYMDADGDGYGDLAHSVRAAEQPLGYVKLPTDCNDTDVGTNPGASEICGDGVDQNCDGMDLFCTYYQDTDGDGYGNPKIAKQSESQPSGYVANNMDCDDTNPDINPSTAEISNDGIDQNCDGNDLITWYADSDDDGYGSPYYSIDAETQPTGYVAELADCDDTNAEIHPGATEISLDGVDQDCNGSDYTMFNSELTPPWSEERWSRTHNFGSSVDQTSDNGFILTGYSVEYNNYDIFLIKTDPIGNQIWAKKFDGGDYVKQSHSVKQTTDGGYIVAGSDGKLNIYLIKTDPDGNIIWESTIGTSDKAEPTVIQQTADGGFIIAGSNNTRQNVGPGIFLVKTTSDGKEVWTQTFGEGKSDLFYALVQTVDGGYVLLGSVRPPYANSDFDIYLIKTDSNGSESWSKTFGGDDDDVGKSVKQTIDGGFIIAGYTTNKSSKTHAVLIKTDENGNEIWSKEFEASDAYAVDVTSDGGLAVCLEAKIDYINYNYLMKTDANGNTIWQKVLTQSVDSYAGKSMMQTTDGGYVLFGTIFSSPVKLFLLKTDPVGDIIE